MIAAAATTASAGSGASPAAAVVPPYDAWGVDSRGETEPRGSHHTVEAALRAGDVVIHGGAVEQVRQGVPGAALDRIIADVLRVDLPALRRALNSAALPVDVVAVWVAHADVLARVGERARTGAWLAAFARAQVLDPRVTAAELRGRIAEAHDHPAPRRGGA